MSTVKLSRLTNTAGARHTVNVKLPLADGEEEIRVVYRGLSLREGTLLEEKYESQENANEALASLLAEHIVALPDIVGDDGNQVKPTAEFFGSIDTYVLHRINRAIREDRTGNPTSRD